MLDDPAMSYTNPAAYERLIGRWSERLTPSFLRFAEVRDGQHVLDVGCGTGSLSRALVSSGALVKVTGIDPVPAYVSFAREAVPHRRAQFQVGTAESLPFPDDAFDGALALLVLQDFIDPRNAVREMARVTRSGGLVATCLWDFEDGLPMLSLFWQAAEVVAPDAVSRQRGQHPPARLATPNDLQALWRSCGLSDIKTATLELSMQFSSFNDYWQPFLEGSRRPRRLPRRSIPKPAARSRGYFAISSPAFSPMGLLSFLHGLGRSEELPAERAFSRARAQSMPLL